MEEEKKYYTERINELEEKISSLEIRNANHLRGEDEWRKIKQQYDQYVDNLQFEKEEILRKFTLETADLRKRNTILVETIQKMETNAASNSTSTSFSDNLAEFESSLMEGAFDFDFNLDDAETKSSTSLVPVRKTDKITISEEDKPAASGLLLIVSRGGPYSLIIPGNYEINNADLTLATSLWCLCRFPRTNIFQLRYSADVRRYSGGLCHCPRQHFQRCWCSSC